MATAPISTAPSAGPPLATEAWWTSLYDDNLADVLLARDDDGEVEATLAFLTDALSIRAGSRVLDQCCGIGSLAIPLAGRGARVVAVDLMPGYIDRARRAAARAGVALDLHVGDAFTFVADPPCEAAFNWWTSFGYARDDATNARMLRRAFESLAPGGRFALDFMNVPGVLRGFRREVVTRRDTPRGEIVLVRESTVDVARGTIAKVWTYALPDGARVSHASTMRLYLPWELAALLAGVGFVDVALLGNMRGEALTMDSERCIALARRPEDR